MISIIFFLPQNYVVLLKSRILNLHLRKSPTVWQRTVSSQSCFLDSHAGVPKSSAVLECPKLRWWQLWSCGVERSKYKMKYCDFHWNILYPNKAGTHNVSFTCNSFMGKKITQQPLISRLQTKSFSSKEGVGKAWAAGPRPQSLPPSRVCPGGCEGRGADT